MDKEQIMGFSRLEKQALMELKGVEDTMILHLEQVGINSFKELAQYRAEDIAEMVASMLNNDRWKNSPSSLETLRCATRLARSNLQGRNEDFSDYFARDEQGS